MCLALAFMTPSDRSLNFNLVFSSYAQRQEEDHLQILAGGEVLQGPRLHLRPRGPGLGRIVVGLFAVLETCMGGACPEKGTCLLKTSTFMYLLASPAGSRHGPPLADEFRLGQVA